MNKQERKELYYEYAKWDLDYLYIPENFKETIGRMPEIFDACDEIEAERDLYKSRCEALERALLERVDKCDVCAGPECSRTQNCDECANWDNIGKCSCFECRENNYKYYNFDEEKFAERIDDTCIKIQNTDT